MTSPSRPRHTRSPRRDPSLPTNEVVILAPTRKPDLPSESVRLMILQALATIAVLVVVSPLAGSSMGWYTILVTASMVGVFTIFNYLRHSRQKEKYDTEMAERERGYQAYLEKDITSRLAKLEKAQRYALDVRLPAPHSTAARVSQTEPSPKMWARVPADPDFLELRLGLGKRSASIKVSVSEPVDPLDPDPLLVQAHKLARQYQTLQNAPISVSLRKAGVTGIAGEPTDLMRMTRALLIQLATHHSPDEVKMLAVYRGDQESELGWMRWLPHVWSSDRRTRYLADDRVGEDGVPDAHRLLVALNDQLNLRRQYLTEYRGQGPVSLGTAIVALFAAPELVENEPVVKRLQLEGPELGVFPIVLANHTKQLWQACGAIVHLRVSPSVQSPFLELMTDLDSAIFFTPDEAELGLAEQFATTMAPIALGGPAGLEEPSALTLLDLLEVRTVEELDISAKWRQNERSERRLAAPIGIGSGKEPLVLDLHERAHGPNGLVAGMVGAGKSELLQTLVASLAVRFPPERLAFFIVDYKGGGMAKPFSGLPHTVGVVDNLQDENLAVRALTSLETESKRRQAVLTAFNFTHIDEYQRAYFEQPEEQRKRADQEEASGVEVGTVTTPTNGAHPTLKAMPYLLVIVDEFAEMKTEQPEVAKKFVRLARTGRALGFRLILAMQKPAGIVDGQIEANTRFRLCLRVAQVEDSQAMLKRPEAAFLKQAGRAYFQVGVNEVFEQFQVAWSGAPYEPQAIAENERKILAVGLDGSRHELTEPQGARAEETQLTALVKRLVEVARAHGRAKLPPLWLDPLPPDIALEAIRQPRGWNGHGWAASGEGSSPGQLEPVIGKYDDPEARAQPTLSISLRKDPHLIVYGAPGSGKAAFVQTLITSLALDQSPAEVTFYLLDFGGRRLEVFETMPHVGAVIVAGDTERVVRLFRYLERELERRQAKRVTSPDIFVVIDNYARFASDYPDTVEVVGKLAREGGEQGLHLVLTTTTTIGLRYQILANVTSAVALRLADRSDYAVIFGKTPETVPAPLAGRGLVKRGDDLVEFQAALPMGALSPPIDDQPEADGVVKATTQADRQVALRKLADDMNAAWQGPRPKRIERLRQVVPLTTMLSPTSPWVPTTSEIEKVAVSLGLLVDDLEPFKVKLAQGPHFLIEGTPQSGKTTLLRTWLLALAASFSPGQVHFYLLDSPYQGLAPLQTLPHLQHGGVGYISEVAKAEEMLRKLERELQVREAGDAARGQAPHIVIAIDDLFNPHTAAAEGPFSENAHRYLQRIARSRGSLGFHLLVAGTTQDLVGNQSREPVKTLKASFPSFVLGQTEYPLVPLRLAHTKIEQSLPQGEAYYTERGKTQRVKLATADATTEDVRLELKDWVARIANRAEAETV